MGRTEQAQSEFLKLASEWGNSESEINRQYVDEARKFLAQAITNVVPNMTGQKGHVSTFDK